MNSAIWMRDWQRETTLASAQPEGIHQSTWKVPRLLPQPWDRLAGQRMTFRQLSAIYSHSMWTEACSWCIRLLPPLKYQPPLTYQSLSDFCCTDNIAPFLSTQTTHHLQSADRMNIYHIAYLQSLAGTNRGNQLLGYSWNYWGSQVVFHNRLGWIAQSTHLRCDRVLSHTHPHPLHSAALCNLPGDISVNTMYNFTRTSLPNIVAALKVRIRPRRHCSSSSRESQGPSLSPLCQMQEPINRFAGKHYLMIKKPHDAKRQKRERQFYGWELGHISQQWGQLDLGMACKGQQWQPHCFRQWKKSHWTMLYDH